MFYIAIYKKVWVSKDNLALEYQIQATEREFNSTGYLTRQILTRTNFPENVVGSSHEMTYEYSE
jgi:hypothetical protein